MKEKKCVNYCINFFKGLACIFVICLHCNLESRIYSIFKELFRCAVPFFIIVSGYYCFDEYKDSCIRKAKKALKKISKLTFLIVIIYVIWNLLKVRFDFDKYYNWLCLELINLRSIFNFIVFNRAVFLSNIAYYLFMMIYVYIFYITSLKLNIDIKKIYYLCPILLFIGILIQTFFYVEWFFIGNWIFTGLPFFFLGNMIRCKFTKANFNNKYIIITLLIGIFISLFTVIFSEKVWFYDIGTIFICISLLIYSINNSNKYIIKFVEKLGAKYSFIIFVIHCIIRDIVEKFSEKLKVNYDYLEVLLIILISIIASAVIKKLYNMLKNKLDGGKKCLR